MHYTEYEGVFFVEGGVENAKILKHEEIIINGIFSETHLKSLDAVKKELQKKAKTLNGNAVINFKYGQKSTFWRSLIGLDNIHWYGSGDIAVIREGEIKK